MEKYCIYNFNGKVKYMFLDGLFLVDPSYMADFKIYHSEAVEVFRNE